MRSIWVFFYGSYMNLDVLAEAGLHPEETEVASLAGFELRIGPLADLVPRGDAVAWGLNVRASHAELERLYGEHARGILGGSYLPEAVLTSRRDGLLRPALTYLAEDPRPAPPDPAYVRRIAAPARALGFPADYLAHIESFVP